MTVRPFLAANEKWTSSSSPSSSTRGSVGRTTRWPSFWRSLANRSEFEQSSRYRSRGTGLFPPPGHKRLDLRFNLQELFVLLNVRECLAHRFEREPVVRRRLVLP